MRVTFEDGTYFTECPVALAHNRVGMSPAFHVKRSRCTICNEDPEDCPHIAGRIYEGKRCQREILDLDIIEVSFVGRPNQPDARIMKMSVDRSDIQDKLGSAFEVGMPVLCDRCLTPCDGVVRPFEQGANVEITSVRHNQSN